MSKWYPGTDAPAVHEVSLDIRAGEFFSLLGPSGSGKTSCLRMIAGFERPSRGRVLLDGVDVSQTPPFKRDVNTVFQNYALFPHMSVLDNVTYPLRMRRAETAEARTRAHDALEAVGLRGFEARLPHQMSGGQRQRAALARALVGRPRVLLLDEPLGALDLQLRQQMQGALKDLQREVDITFVYVTHDQNEALSMSDRLAVVSGGVVEQVGAPQEVYFRPRTRFVAGFIGKANLVDVVVHQGDGGRTATRGDLSFPVPAEFATGPATLSLRYEAVEVRPQRGAKDVEVAGRVEHVVFLGECVEVVTTTPGGVRIAARSSLASIGDLRPGDPVTVGFDRPDLVRLDG